MKLHLPLGLLAAVLSLYSLAFAAPQTLTITTPGGAQIEGGNSRFNWSENTGDLTSWEISFEMQTAGGLTKDVFNLNAASSAGTGYHLSFTDTTLYLKDNGGNALITLDGVINPDARTAITLRFEKDVDDAGASLGTGKFTLTSGTSSLTSQVTAGSGNEETAFKKDNGQTRIWTNGGGQKFYNITLTKLDDHSLVSSAYIWNAEDSASCTWDTVSEIWLLEDTPTMFTNGGDAKFTGDAAYKQVTIDSSVTAGKVTVSADYTFNTTGSGFVESSRLTIAEGSTLTVNGAGAVSTQELVNKGTLSIGEGARVAVSSTPVEVASGTSFVVTGAGTLEVATMRSKGGAINISSNLSVTGGGDGTMGNNQNGLCINGGAGGSINILGGVTTVTGAVYTGNGSQENAINVGTGSENATLVTTRLELGDTNGSTGTFTIGEKGKVVIQGSENVRSDQANPQKKTSLQLAEWNQVVTSTINGKLYAENAIAFMSNDASSTVNIAGGTMAVKGIATTNATSARAHTFTLDGGKLILGDTGITEEPGAWTISFANGEIGTYAGSTVVGRSFTTSGNLTFNTAMYTWTGDAETKEIVAGEAGATITVSGNITGDGTIIKTGDGTLMLAGDNNALTHTIDLQKGTLDVTTAVLDISNMDGITLKGYSDGLVNGNGFATMGGTVDVVAVGTGATLSREGVQVKFRGTDVTMDDNGDVTLEDAKSLTTFYVNVGGSTESLANAVTKGGGELTTVDLANNTKLAADQAADLGALVVRADASAGVELSKDVAFETLTVTTKDKTLTLTGAGTLSAGTVTGSGTIVIGNDTTLVNSSTAAATTDSATIDGSGRYDAGAAQAMTLNIAEGWTGTVRIGGFASGNDTHLDSFVNGDKSILEINGITGGHLPEWIDGTVTANIRLADNGDTAAWTWTNGTTGTTPVNLTFSGKWSGDGTFVKTGGYNQSFTFTGDIKDWTGSFVYASGNYTTNLTLKDNVGEVNALIEKAGNGTLNIMVETDVTFNAAIDASKLDVSAGKTATLHTDEDYTISGGLSGTGSLVKTGTGAVTIASPTGTSAAMLDITVSEGTLKATAANVLGTGDITVDENATLDLTNGGALGATQTVANSGNVLLHSTLTQGAVNGGKLTIASDFPSDGEILDVDGTDTGNGFSQGGVVQVYDTAHASLSDDIDIVHGENHYALTDLTNGAITLSGADWNTYQLNVDAQYTVQEIMDYAKANEGELKTISVNADMLTIENDSATLKTSMLGGEHLATFAVYMSGVSGLTIDGDCGAAITTNTGAEGAVTLTKDATVGSIVAGDFENGGAGNLTINGEGHTVKADGAGAAFGGVLALGKGVTLELLHDTSFTTMQNATVKLGESASLVLNEVSFSTVEGGTGATIKVTSDEYIPMYAPHIAEYSITGARITYTTSANFDLGHVIDATSQVVNKGTGSLRDISTNEKYAELNAEGGDIFISTAEDAGTDERALIVGDLTLSEGRTVAEDTGKAVAITVNGTAGFGSGSKLGTALTMAAGSTLDGATALASHALSLDGGINIGDTLWSTLNALAAEGSANIFTGVSALTLAGAEYSDKVDLSDIFDHASLKPNKFSLSYDGSNVIVTKNLENNRYWKGGTGTWDTTSTVWTDEETGGSDVAFVNGYNAHFTSAAGDTGGQISLGADITAASVNVSGINHTFDDAGGAYTLTVTDSVNVTGGSTAGFTFALSGENLKLKVGPGSSLVVGGSSSVKDVAIEASGTLAVADKTTPSLTVTDSFVNSGSVLISDGALDLKKGTAQGGYVKVDTLKLASGESYTFGELKADTVSGTGANLAIAEEGSMTVSDSATVAGLSLAADSTVAGAGTVTAGSVTLSGTAAPPVTLQGKLSTASLDGTGTLFLSDGSLTVTGTTDLSDITLVSSGSSTIATSGAGITLTFGGSVYNAPDGTVTFTGSFDVGNCATTDGTAIYVEGGSPANGFKQAQKIVSVITDGQAVGTGATLTYNGKPIGQMDDNGKVTFQGDTDYTKFYVNSGTENASTAMNNAKWTSASSFVLNSNTTLVVDHEGISLGMVNMPAGAALLQIESGYTVATDGSSKNLMLTGAGELAVDAGKDTPGVVFHASQWTGTVSLRDVELTQLDSDWGTANSTVALQNASGALGNAEVKYDLELRKGAGDSWGYGGTSSTKDSHLWLNGDLKGDGDLGVRSGSAASVFELNGNTDAWTGNFVANNANATLKLTGDDKTINGTVNGSNLALVVETNATLKSDSTVARVNATAGSLKVDNGKTLTVTGFTGPEGLKLGAGASIVLQDTAYMGGEDYGYVGGTVANGTTDDQAVKNDNANITVTGATLRVNGGSGFTVDNMLVNATLAVEKDLPSTVTLNNVQDSLEVAGDLEIGPSGLLKVANGGSKQTLNISDGTTLTLADSTTLDADLTLNRGATLKLDYNMGTPVATTLNGGGLTLYKGLTLSGDLYETLKGLSTEGASVTLFSNVDTIVFDGATTATVDASTYFTNLLDLEGDYTFNYDEGLLSIVFSEATSRQLVWDGTETEHRWVAYEPEAIDPEVKDWYQPSTETETHFAQGDIATFGADADVKVVNLSAGETTAKRVTIKDAADYEFVADAAGSKLSANRFEVKEGATLNKSGTGTLILEVGENVTVDTAGFFVDEGELVIGTAEMPGTLALDNGVMEVAEDATLRVAKIQDSEGSLIAVCGTLNVASGSLHAIHTIEGSTLVISNVNGVSAGTLTIDSDTTLRTLENHGTLDVGTHSLTLTKAAVQGGNVTAGSLHLGEFGSTFGDVTTDTVHFAYGMLDVVDPNVSVDTIVSNAGAIITLDLTEALTDSGCLSPMHRQDMPTTYTLIHTEDGLGTTSFTLGETLGLLVQNGLIHEGEGLTMTEKDVKITVGGQSLIWYTDKDVTEWGYQVVSGDALTAGGNTLNGVEHVVVDASRRIDVTGAGSAPGLRVRNITGLDGRTITFTGTEDDTVNLITNEETASNVNVAAENITLKVGLDKLDEMDPVDYKDLRVGDVNLTSATLDVHDHEGLDDSFTVNSLNGDSASLLKGTLIVEGQGGAYNGGYEGATVILHKDADQALAAGRGLTVMGLGLARITYSGTETHMDGIEGIGLRVMLNDVETDNSHRTLTLDNEYSYIVDGALGVGLSAIESGITLDSEAAPDLLRAEHLDMSGSTLYIYQPASDGDTLTMDVNDGGYKRGLLLANLGADDTTADAVQLIGDLYNKYYQNARLQNGRVLVDRRTDYFSSITEPTSENGRAGAGMLDDALLYNNPQATQAGGDLAVVMTALETGGYTHDRADKVMAAMSGASQAAMGAAWNRDVDRQLRAIRNRTTQMGLAECTHHEGLPYFNAWINAEGDYTKLSGDGTLAGYKLSSWGGTVGVDVDCTARFTVGAAVTAMSGDFTAESADQAEGDLDRLYVSVFGRYTRRAWTHTLVATFGMADTKLKRTVNYDYGSYNTESSSDGKAFGVMYEVGYVTALNEDASTCLQPVLNLSYRHSSLGGSTEQSASDAALRLGDVDADVFTAAVGARLQSAVGTSVYNRSSIFEGRVMLKFDAGDRDTTASNGFIGVPGSRSTKSTEAGMFGVEVGAGLTIPLSENAGALFFDVTGDFRAKDTEFNGTVGYRYNF